MKVRKIIGEIQKREVIAKGSSVKARKRLNKYYGQGDWIKVKGFARVEITDGSIIWTEIHWFEAHGIGKVEIKPKP